MVGGRSARADSLQRSGLLSVWAARREGRNASRSWPQQLALHPPVSICPNDEHRVSECCCRDILEPRRINPKTRHLYRLLTPRRKCGARKLLRDFYFRILQALAQPWFQGTSTQHYYQHHSLCLKYGFATTQSRWTTLTCA